MFEYIKDILAFNADNFHFLRPRLIWAFLPVVLVAGMILMNTREDNKWKRVIAPVLRPFMFTREKRTGFLFPLINYLLIMSLGILGIAGPTWNKTEVPGSKSEAVLLIALDVSPSMLAEDIQPNRLERAKFKILDLLDANPGSRVSLYAYSGTAHTVIPNCSDYRIIRHHLKSLSPGIMPVQGTNLEMMMSLADSALQKVKAPSTLMLVTDALKSEDIGLLSDFVDRTPHKIELLAMATPQGAEIPRNRSKNPMVDKDGNVVISRLNTEILFELQSHPKINVNTLTLDNSDMEFIAGNIRTNLDYQQDEQESEEQWKDMGYVLLIMLVLLLPFWFRKGWMIQYGWIPFIIFMSSCSQVQSWDDLWYTRDYQAQKLYEEEAYEEAAFTFNSPFHQGVAYYRAGNFDAAAQAFALDSTSNSLYNLGMAYTQMGMYDEALEVITLAASKDPENKQFREAIHETELTIGIIDSLKSVGEPTVLPEKQEEKGELIERKAASKDEELTSDTEVEELPEEGDRVTDEVETQMRKAEEMEEVPEDFEPGSEGSPQNVLLRGISEDPSQFLRRRFSFQVKKYNMNQGKREEPW